MSTSTSEDQTVHLGFDLEEHMGTAAISDADATGRPLVVHFFVNFVHQQGTYFRFHNLAKGLLHLGHKVAVYASDHNPRSKARSETRDGVPYHITPEHRFVYRIWGKNCDPILFVRRAKIHYPPCDVAHLFQPFPGAAGAWWQSSSAVRFYDWDDLWTGALISTRTWRWEALTVRFLERRLPRWADRVTTVGKFLGDRAVAAGAVEPLPVYNGCNLSAPVDRRSARERFGLVLDATYVGFMGRTYGEINWCFDAIAAAAPRYPKLRFALCGPPPSVLEEAPDTIRDRIDYLGQLAPSEIRQFAGALDLGLLPLENNSFNLSRFPIKFSEHLATGVPLLCSTVGECGRLVDRFPTALPAGHTRDEWIAAFLSTLDRLSSGDIPKFDVVGFNQQLTWDGISQLLAGAYINTLSDVKRRGRGQ